MTNTEFPPLGSTIDCTIKVKSLVEIPMYEDLTYELLDLMVPDENEKRIRSWMARVGIEINNYDKYWHKFKPSDEIVLDVFWKIVNHVVHTEEAYKLIYFKNILLNTIRSEADDLEQINAYIDIVASCSHNHIKVLKLMNGVLDYFLSVKIPMANSIPETLAHSIEYGISELRGQREKYTQIWNDLLELGLRKESSLHRWMTGKMFVYMSLTTDFGKRFLKVISK